MNKLKELFNDEKEISIYQVILTVVFTVSLIISNIISGRTFNFFGNTMTSAVVVFPITYILSDLFSEVYGYKWSRLTCYLGFLLNLITVGVFLLVNALPTLPWMEETAGAFNTLLGGVSASTFASFIAYVVGDLVNDKVFQKMKESHPGLTNQTGFGTRAILSSLAGELCDSCIYLPLAFCIFNPIMSLSEVIIMIMIQVGLKMAYEIIILPLNSHLVKKLALLEKK